MASVGQPQGSVARTPAAARAPEAPDGDRALLPADNAPILVVGIMLASLLQILDSTIANVAIPHMQATLGATPDQISWVLTSYIVASAVAMPLTGWLADRIGSRRLFILSVAGFVLSSMACGMSQNITEMVMFRALQGVTGAFVSPLSQTALIDTNKPSKQAQMMALWGMGIMIGPILGPILGGWLTENWNWRWVFYVNVPLGAVALMILAAALPSRKVVRRRFDLFGFAMVGMALTALQLLLDRGNNVDWFDATEAWIYLVVVICSVWIGAIHLITAREPLFDRALFADRNYVVALLFMLVMGMVMFATMALLPPMLQRLLNYSVLDTGIVMMPRGMGTLISMQVSSRLMRRGLDPRLLVGCGFVIAALSLWEMSAWSLGVDRFHIVASGFIQGLGMGLVFIPLNASAFATLPARLRTDGSSLLNLLRSMGASIGIAVVTALLARNVQVSHQDLAGHVTGSIMSNVDFSTLDRFQALGTSVLGMIDAEVNRQAAMVAYIDDFYLMMWMTFFALPLVLLMRKADLSKPRPAEDLPH